MQNNNETTMDTVRPVVVISRCLGFDACRWNQAMIPSEVVRLLRPHVEVLTPCPEVEIGLGVPREPIRVIEEEGRRILYQPAREREVTGGNGEVYR